MNFVINNYLLILLMSLLRGRLAFFILGYGLGITSGYTTNDIYVSSLRKHIIAPVQNELKGNPVDWTKVKSTLK